jgi:hypothetical protein
VGAAGVEVLTVAAARPDPRVVVPAEAARLIYPGASLVGPGSEPVGEVVEEAAGEAADSGETKARGVV